MLLHNQTGEVEQMSPTDAIWRSKHPKHAYHGGK